MNGYRKEVRVYHDPISQKNFEGSATVSKVYQIGVGTPALSFCKVRFLSGPEPRTNDRWVDNEQLKNAGAI